MILNQNYSLKNHNTFHLDVKTKYFAAPQNLDEIKELLDNKIAKTHPTLILGEGSNSLFTKDYNGLVIKPSGKFVHVTDSGEHDVWIEVGAGVSWDDFVKWSVNNSFYGIENLSLIPGSVGACPVQNIGAYGVEVKDVISQVNGIFLDSLEPFQLKNKDCHFGYRNSIFKNEFKNRIIITSVIFKLQKSVSLKMDYGDVRKRVEDKGEINLKNIREAIIEIRESKLPDTKRYGNAGSFFKNPVLSQKKAQKFIKEFPEAPFYTQKDGSMKIPAAWLIDACQWKGKTMGNAAVHEKQALVLINRTGNATGTEILDLAAAIEKSVIKKFNIKIEKEVNII